MQTEIDYCVNNPVDRKPLKVIIRYGKIENIIHRTEVDGLDKDSLKVWQLCGLNKSQIQEIVGFLRS